MKLHGGEQSIWRAFGNPSLIALLIAATLTTTASSIYGALFNYIQAYFFGLTTIQIGIMTVAPFLSALIALYLSPILARGREKRTLGFLLLMCAILGQPAMIVLRLAGYLPPNGDPLLLPLLAFHSAFESMLWVLVWVMLSSMQADIVEDVQRQTGQQAAGLLFAVRAFVGKVISASAVLITGLLLDLVHFPAGAQPGGVSHDVLTRLGAYFTPLYLAIGLVAAASLWGYRISRAVHMTNLAAVARDA